MAKPPSASSRAVAELHQAATSCLLFGEWTWPSSGTTPCGDANFLLVSCTQCRKAKSSQPLMGEICFPLRPVFASSSVSSCCCRHFSTYELGRDTKNRNANRNKVQRNDVRCVVSVVPYQNVSSRLVGPGLFCSYGHSTGIDFWYTSRASLLMNPLHRSCVWCTVAMSAVLNSNKAISQVTAVRLPSGARCNPLYPSSPAIPPSLMEISCSGPSHSGSGM